MDVGALVWGWHEDPCGIHEERWVSVDGVPTKLVRDAGHESYDPPPDLGARSNRLTQARARKGQPPDSPSSLPRLRELWWRLIVRRDGASHVSSRRLRTDHRTCVTTGR